MLAMHPKRREGKWEQLVYIDLLAGPGTGIDRKTRVEFDGSPLRALQKMTEIGFEAQDEGDPCFRNKKNSAMYHLLFFSRNPAGLRIWRNIKKIEPTGQRTLPGV